MCSGSHKRHNEQGATQCYQAFLVFLFVCLLVCLFVFFFFCFFFLSEWCLGAGNVHNPVVLLVLFLVDEFPSTFFHPTIWLSPWPMPPVCFAVANKRFLLAGSSECRLREHAPVEDRYHVDVHRRCGRRAIQGQLLDDGTRAGKPTARLQYVCWSLGGCLKKASRLKYSGSRPIRINFTSRFRSLQKL